MATAERTIAIRRPVDQVYRFLADRRTATQWRAGELEITGREPDRRVTFRLAVGQALASGEFDLEAMGDATILTFRLSAKLPWWRRLLVGRAVQMSMDAELRALDNLQEVLER